MFVDLLKEDNIKQMAYIKYPCHCRASSMDKYVGEVGINAIDDDECKVVVRLNDGSVPNRLITSTLESEDVASEYSVISMERMKKVVGWPKMYTL